MSLINKMLQDLDARGGDGSRAATSPVMRPVGQAQRAGLSPRAIGAGVVALAALGGAGFVAFKYFGGGGQPVPTVVASPALVASPVPVALPPPAAAPTPEPAPAPVAPDAKGSAAPLAHVAGGSAASADAGQRSVAGVGAEDRAAASADKPKSARVQSEEMRRITGIVPMPATSAPAGSHAPEPQVREREAGKRGSGAAGEGSEASLSSQQKAENEYRRALASLQDARVNEAIAGLEQAVYLYPRHEAARQTLVSLLIEGGRPAEAIRHLTFATSLDPRQSNMAMLLARLQLEHGGNALGTLQRCLAYAESNPDYRAMLAGVLERHGRHKDAAEHYQAAVRLQPGNAVWWMGMGISLQGDKRNAEAKVAFQRARDTGRLTPELQTFVERRLQQLN